MWRGQSGFGRADLGGDMGMDDGFGDNMNDDELGMRMGMGPSGRQGFGNMGDGLDQSMWGAQGLGKRGSGAGRRRSRRDRPPPRRRRGGETDPMGEGPFMSGGNGLGGLGGFGGLAEEEDEMGWEDGM